MTRQGAQELLAICEAADDQDTGSLDAFREAATVGVVAELCRRVVALEEAAQNFFVEYDNAEHGIYAPTDETEAKMRAALGKSRPFPTSRGKPVRRKR